LGTPGVGKLWLLRSETGFSERGVDFSCITFADIQGSAQRMFDVLHELQT
jgi:hypothetical protein